MATIPPPLTSIPGLAATLLAESSHVTRFARLEAVVAYAGVAPSRYASGPCQGHRGHLSKRGSPYWRRAPPGGAPRACPHNADLGASLDQKRAEGKP